MTSHVKKKASVSTGGSRFWKDSGLQQAETTVMCRTGKQEAPFPLWSILVPQKYEGKGRLEREREREKTTNVR